jgi:uncharacterized protein (TIGR02246 family)
MKRSTLRIGALLVAVNCIVLRASSAAESPAQDQAIQQTAKAFVEAFDSGNAPAVAALWTDEGEYIVGETTVKGRPAIQQLYEEFFRAHPGSKMEVSIDSIRTLAPTVAIEQGTASVTSSSDGAPSASAYTAVHVKQGDKWLMASVRESPTPLPSARQGLQELAWLVGSWAAWGDAAKVEVTYDWIANKNFLRSETTVTSNEGPASGGTQIIGKDPLSGQIVSWFFNADGGHGYGVWSHDGSRWLIRTQGAAADGAPTTATNVLYHADDNVLSWQSVDRTAGDQPLPNTKEIVIERVSGAHQETNNSK